MNPHSQNVLRFFISVSMSVEPYMTPLERLMVMWHRLQPLHSKIQTKFFKCGFFMFLLQNAPPPTPQKWLDCIYYMLLCVNLDITLEYVIPQSWRVCVWHLTIEIAKENIRKKQEEKGNGKDGNNLTFHGIYIMAVVSKVWH